MNTLAATSFTAHSLMSKRSTFLAYHRDNPEVWLYFKRYAFKLIEAGHTKFSQRMIWESMRMDAMLNTTGYQYKLNNNYTKFYAEIFMQKHPQYGDVFDLRGESALLARSA